MNILKRTAYILVMCFIFGSPTAMAQMKWNSAYKAYVDQYKDLAIEQMLRYNIPASITLAQGLLESAAGRSDLTRAGNNLRHQVPRMDWTTCLSRRRCTR